jgi:thymidylate kinase
MGAGGSGVADAGSKPGLRRGGAGRVLTVAGPDGTGKSTLCEALIEGVLRDRAVLRVHHRFGVLPARGGERATVTEPHRDEPYPAPLAALKALALFADFWLGWLLRARPFVRRGGWVLLERGWWDLAVDPQRYRLRPGGRLVRALGRLLPQADVLLVLEGPPAMLWARKQELPEAELERQVRAWHDVVPARVRRVHLDTSAPLDEVVRRAEVELRSVAL